MLNREKIIKILKKYHFDSNRYVVISSAAMVLLGYKKKTKDIDISVTQSLYDELLQTYNCVLEKTNELGNKVYFIDDIINFGINYYTSDYVVIDGIPVQKVEDIKKLKQFLNREKDKADLRLLDEKTALYKKR